MISVIIVDIIVIIPPLLKQSMLNMHSLSVSLRVIIFDASIFIMYCDTECPWEPRKHKIMFSPHSPSKEPHLLPLTQWLCCPSLPMSHGSRIHCSGSGFTLIWLPWKRGILGSSREEWGGARMSLWLEGLNATLCSLTWQAGGLGLPKPQGNRQQ